ncbi:MAG: DUF4399 domain-containing protein [Chloroflexota bacterium]|nr:DUF4399 domain-containing protein [Chloroflexota bacterium]
MKSLVNVVWAAVLLVVLLSLTATTTLAQEPTLNITTPEAGATVEAPVTVSWTAEGVTIRPAAEATAMEEGHFHVFVDREPQLQEGEPIPTGDPQIIHTAATSAELADLAAGEHTVTVVLGFSDHTPWQPTVMDSVTFTVAGEEGEAPTELPETGGAALPWMLLLIGTGLALLVAGVQLRQRQT